MSAYNSRRTGKERRVGARRWLGDFTKNKPYHDKRGNDRRTDNDRRDRHNTPSRIGF